MSRYVRGSLSLSHHERRGYTFRFHFSPFHVQVAVRTRPFNKREKARNAKLIVAMNGPTTIITDPGSGEEKKFAFDYSYWSFDGFKEEKNGYCAPDSKHPNGKKFCDQVRNKPNITGICSTPNTDLSSLTHYVHTHTHIISSVRYAGQGEAFLLLHCTQSGEIQGDHSNLPFTSIQALRFSMWPMY